MFQFMCDHHITNDYVITLKYDHFFIFFFNFFQFKFPNSNSNYNYLQTNFLQLVASWDWECAEQERVHRK